MNLFLCGNTVTHTTVDTAYPILFTRPAGGSKVILRAFPHIPVTKKPLEVRMGKGKGSVDHFVSFVRAGRLLFEFNCESPLSAKKAYKAMKYKLPIDIGFIEQAHKQHDQT